MISRDKAKIVAFIEYAMDTEGMEYKARLGAAERWVAVPVGKYDPQVMGALERNFNEEWKAFGG